MVYSDKISEKLHYLTHHGPDIKGSAATAVNFGCGSFLRFSLTVDIDTREVADVSFSSNGCGFMLAAADVLAVYVKGKRLTALQGLADIDLIRHIFEHLDRFPVGRRECLAVTIEALHAAFADQRSRRCEEFQGEKALICTCFGVSEETIEDLIAEDSLKTVEEVTATCNAGGGCGSCRMLIQEMLDDSRV